MRYTVILFFFLIQSVLTAENMQRGRIKFEESEVLRQTGTTVIFPVITEQKSGEYLVIEGEDFSSYAPVKANQTLAYSPEYSNGAAVINARSMGYDFVIAEPGEYQVWIRAYFPLQANYNHTESMDGDPAGKVIDSADPAKISKTEKSGFSAMPVSAHYLPPKVWHWTPNRTYHLTKGRHRWRWLSPTAWCGGCILDKIVLIKKTSALKPENANTENRILHRQKSGELISRRIKIARIKSWMFEYTAAPGEGKIDVEYSYDEQNFKPLKNGTRYETSGVKSVYLWIKIKMQNTEYGKCPPILYHYVFKFQKKNK